MKSKFLSISLASTAMILFFIFASFTSSVALAQGATPTIKETRITSSGYSFDPAIYGNIIVWQDKRNGIDDIYMYNLCTKRETRITNTGRKFSLPFACLVLAHCLPPGLQSRQPAVPGPLFWRGGFFIYYLFLSLAFSLGSGGGCRLLLDCGCPTSSLVLSVFICSA